MLNRHDMADGRCDRDERIIMTNSGTEQAVKGISWFTKKIIKKVHQPVVDVFDVTLSRLSDHPAVSSFDSKATAAASHWRARCWFVYRAGSTAGFQHRVMR
ncbi:MAG: hypothetical protein AB2805_07130 [Candidatus Thiodiazotropha sp.]